MIKAASLVLATAVVHLLCTGVVFASLPQVLSCKDSIIEKFEDVGSGGCREHPILFRFPESLTSEFVDEVRCHFSNHLTLYAYQESEILKLDIKGLSGQYILDHSSEVDHTENFENCAQLQNRIEEISNFKAEPLAAIERREFVSHDSILIVASSKSCLLLNGELQSLLQIYQAEGRSKSKLVCLSDALVRQKNPSAIRKFIQTDATAVDGILLVGSDLPPFEYFSRTGYGDSWNPYEYGTSDLPYGNFNDDFWSKPLKKKAKGIAEVVYRSKDYIYPMDGPSLYTFEFSNWVEKELKASSQNYIQSRWVARWLGSEEKIQESMRNFVNRRSEYRPAVAQQIIYARGGESFMMTPGEANGFDIMNSVLKARLDGLSPNSSLRVYSDSDLEQFIRFVSPETTTLVLDEHGQPEGLGNLNAQALDRLSPRLPEILHLHSCLVGAWGYASSPTDSFIGRAFTVQQPPLLLTASQGILGIPTLTVGVDDLPRPFLTYWRPTQSIGQRQVESINESLYSWRNYSPLAVNYIRWFTIANIFHTTSIFGDGSVEF